MSTYIYHRNHSTLDIKQMRVTYYIAYMDYVDGIGPVVGPFHSSGWIRHRRYCWEPTLQPSSIHASEFGSDPIPVQLQGGMTCEMVRQSLTRNTPHRITYSIQYISIYFIHWLHSYRFLITSTTKTYMPHLLPNQKLIWYWPWIPETHCNIQTLHCWRLEGLLQTAGTKRIANSEHSIYIIPIQPGIDSIAAWFKTIGLWPQ